MTSPTVEQDRTRPILPFEGRARPVGGSGEGAAAGVDFERFLDLELDGLARYARTLSGDRHRAHDLLAESMIKAQRAWPRICRTDHPVAYVRRIITNTLMSERRSWFARTVFVTRSGALPDRAVPGSAGRIDDRDELDRMLQTLPPRQRAAIVLRYYLDLDDNRIADELECSVSAVRSYISRGLAALRIDRATGANLEDGDGRR